MEEVLEVVFTTLKRYFLDDQEVIKSIYYFLLEELHQAYFHIMYTSVGRVQSGEHGFSIKYMQQNYPEADKVYNKFEWELSLMFLKIQNQKHSLLQSGLLSLKDVCFFLLIIAI